MAIITPTITAENPHVYREQMQRISPFAKRVHIDLMDGVFAPSKSIAVGQVWLPENIPSDIHVMFQNPEELMGDLCRLQPNLIILPAEANFDFAKVRALTKERGIKLGVALLAETPLEVIQDTINELDHILIFSGNLGYQGGSIANLELLSKIGDIKAQNPLAEIGWDGGVNESNVQRLAESGVDIINVGGFIHTAPDAGLAYSQLSTLLP